MKKIIYIVIVAVLVVGLGGSIYMFLQKDGDLTSANLEIDTHKSTIFGLQTDLSTSKAETADTQSRLTSTQDLLTAEQKKVSDLEAAKALLESEKADLTYQLSSTKSSLTSAQSSLSSAQTVNATLSADLKKVKDPRHFESLSELTNWLQKDDTDTKYASLAQGTWRDYELMCFILQVRAARDGYILPAYILPPTSSSGGAGWLSNYAIIGDVMYIVEAGDDSVSSIFTFSAVQPSHPEPLP